MFCILLAKFTWPWAPTQWAIFFGSSFFGFYAIIQVFRARDWLSSISAVKIMAQKPKCGKNYTLTNANLGYITPQDITGHNSPSDYARELFKPCKVDKSLVLCYKKNVSVLDLRFFVYVSMMARCLCIFCLYSDDVNIPWEVTKWVNFVAQSFFWFLSVIQVYRAHDWFSSVSGSKIIAKRLEIN